MEEEEEDEEEVTDNPDPQDFESDSFNVFLCKLEILAVFKLDEEADVHPRYQYAEFPFGAENVPSNAERITIKT